VVAQRYHVMDHPVVVIHKPSTDKGNVNNDVPLSLLNVGFRPSFSSTSSSRKVLKRLQELLDLVGGFGRRSIAAVHMHVFYLSICDSPHR